MVPFLIFGPQLESTVSSFIDSPRFADQPFLAGLITMILLAVDILAADPVQFRLHRRWQIAGTVVGYDDLLDRIKPVSVDWLCDGQLVGVARRQTIFI